MKDLFGIGLRPDHYQDILREPPKLGWFEAISENYMGIGGRPIFVLEKVRENYPVVLHGVSLSIGSVDPLNKTYLQQLRDLIAHIEPSWISDHLCWTGVEGENLHDLLPLPFNEETLNHLVPRILEVQEFLKRPIALENVSSYLTFTESEMTEWDFITEVSRRTDCRILLDINNIYVSSVNHRFDPMKFVEGVPVDRVVQFHLAGYSDMGEYLIDTHDHPVSKAVWDLYAKAVKRFGSVPVLLERDADVPPLQELLAELEMARSIRETVLGSGGGA